MSFSDFLLCLNVAVCFLFVCVHACARSCAIAVCLCMCARPLQICGSLPIGAGRTAVQLKRRKRASEKASERERSLGPLCLATLFGVFLIKSLCSWALQRDGIRTTSPSSSSNFQYIKKCDLHYFLFQ